MKGWPIGRQPWDTTVAGADGGVEEHADGAVVDERAVEHQPVAARAPGGRGQAADRRPGAGGRARELGQEAVDGEGERVGEEQQRAARRLAASGSRPSTAQPSASLVRRVSRTGVTRPGRRPAHSDRPGVVLHAAAAADDRDRRRSDERTRGRSSAADGGGHVLERADVAAGHEQDGQVGLGAQPLERPAPTTSPTAWAASGCSESDGGEGHVTLRPAAAG